MQDAEGFDAFYRATRNSVELGVLAAADDATAARDAVQDAYARAWLRWIRLRRSTDPQSWVSSQASRLLDRRAALIDGHLLRVRSDNNEWWDARDIRAKGTRLARQTVSSMVLVLTLLAGLGGFAARQVLSRNAAAVWLAGAGASTAGRDARPPEPAFVLPQDLGPEFRVDRDHEGPLPVWPLDLVFAACAAAVPDPPSRAHVRGTGSRLLTATHGRVAEQVTIFGPGWATVHFDEWHQRVVDCPTIDEGGGAVVRVSIVDFELGGDDSFVVRRVLLGAPSGGVSFDVFVRVGDAIALIADQTDEALVQLAGRAAATRLRSAQPRPASSATLR